MANRYDIPEHPIIANLLRYGEPYPRQVKAVYICSGCGGMIYEDDWYWDYGGEQYCEVCNDRNRQLAVATEP